MSTQSTEVLKISLHNHTVGYLVGTQDRQNDFILDENYQTQNNSPTFTLTSHTDFPNSKKLLAETWHTHQRLHPVFSNLLPEGAYRQWLAQILKILPDNEFPLLQQLGFDLPGAIIATPLSLDDIPDYVLKQSSKITIDKDINTKLKNHFSLAGEQMKFSMKKQDGRYLISQQGELGTWIIKTPSTRHQYVPANEYTCMTLASIVGIEIPDIQIVAIDKIENLPDINLPNETEAYAIRRFDRAQNNTRIHSEDFAQVLFKYPHDKYQSANYEQIARVLYQYSANPLRDVQQLARRLLVNILLANGDAHLKNWSLIYRDGITPELAPAYNILTTHLYIENETEFALNLGGTKSWYDVNLEHFEAWANKSDIPWRAILPQLQEVLQLAREKWPAALEQSKATQAHKKLLRKHWALLHNNFQLLTNPI